MSLHRACCPCGNCYRGTLCESCLAPCDIEQPSPVAYITAAQWLEHIDDLPGTGSGAVVWVDGAWYYFDGSTVACQSRAEQIDWTISFRADACPDYSVSLDIIVPFSGGFDFRDPWNVSVALSDVVDPIACMQNHWANTFPGDTTVVVSASQPDYQPWFATFTNIGSDPLLSVYGLGVYTVVGDGTLTQLAPPYEFIAYKPGCAQPPLDPSLPTATTSIEAFLFADPVEPSEASFSGEPFKFVQTCPTGSFSVSLTSTDADGYFVCIVNSFCTIRYIGPVSGFVNAFNATFAGTGITAELQDEDWFLGCKVREEYVGSAYQASFPAAGVGALSGSTTSLGDEIQVVINETAYGRLHGIAGFNASSDVVLEDLGVTTYVGPYCPSDDLPCGTGFDAYATHPTGVGNYVRERYGVSLMPETWLWNAQWMGDPTDPCKPIEISWTVT